MYSPRVWYCRIIMRAKRAYVKTERTPEELAELRAVREKYQREKPSLAQALAESGEAAPMPLGAVIMLHQILAGLKKAREESGVTLADLAQRTGIDIATLSKLESGKHGNPTLATIARISNALGKMVRCTIENNPATAGGQRPKESRPAPVTSVAGR